MKKRLMILSVIALVLGGNQTAEAQNWRNAPQYHFGIRGGISGTTSMDDGGDGDNGTYDLWGPTFGVAFDTKVAKIPFYIETGLYYMNRGQKYDVWSLGDYTPSYATRYTENNHSLLVPALISYHAYTSRNVSIQPFTGPFFAYGFNDEEFDFGWRLGCGLNVQQFYVNLGVDFGLKDDFERHEGQVSSFFMTVGWNFLGKR